MKVADLAPVYLAEGPFVTVVLATESRTEDAAEQLRIRWDVVLRELDGLGVDGATREALTAARGDHSLGGARLLVASGGEVRLAVSLPEPPPTESVRVDPLPHLGLLVDHLSMQQTYVLAQVDRTGADVHVHGELAVPDVGYTVEGSRQHHLTKVRGAGMAQARMQRRAEQNWQFNAEDVASVVDSAAREVSADLVVLTGDETMTAELERRLPERLLPLTVRVPGGRASPTARQDSVADHVVEAVTQRFLAQREAFIDKFRQEVGQEDKGSAGVADTVRALQRGQVDVLVLSDALADTDGWFGPEAAQLSTDRQELVDMGVERPVSAPLVDVLLRAAVGTAASVAFFAGDDPSTPGEGVGALLRYALPDGV